MDTTKFWECLVCSTAFALSPFLQCAAESLLELVLGRSVKLCVNPKETLTRVWISKILGFLYVRSSTVAQTHSANLLISGLQQRLPQLFSQGEQSAPQFFLPLFWFSGVFSEESHCLEVWLWWQQAAGEKGEEAPGYREAIVWRELMKLPHSVLEEGNSDLCGGVVWHICQPSLRGNT